MGIPSYFKHVISKYKFILTEYYKHALKIDNLYIDSQSLIYDAVLSDTIKSVDTKFIEDAIIKEVIKKIGVYISQICPKQKVYIAFDGVAPVAKMQQQRSRRYKSENEKKIFEKIGIHKERKWNTTALTPGTQFMKKLNENVYNSFTKPSKYNVKEIIVSGSDKPGEGEHKIFEYIRNNKDYHYQTTSAIYGLDSDLIMLSLNHMRISDNIYLFRETPHFIKSIDSSLIPDKNYMLNIPAMGRAITSELNYGKNIINETQKNRLFDYIFICFFLGNDFLPHFPSLNIRTDGMSRIINAYKQTICKSGNLTKENGIVWKNVRMFISILSADEEMFFQQEHIIRDKQSKNSKTCRQDEDPLMAALMNIPVNNREKEEYINPFEDGWRERYYTTLFDSERTEENTKLIAINYLEGLEWTFLYYTTGCPDWEWHYKYHYPPLLVDLKKYIPYFDQSFIIKGETTPVDPNVQLAYVLPRNCLSLLPKNIEERILTDKPEWYDETNNDIEFSYCRYFWEGHIKTPNIDLKELKNIIEVC